MVLFFSPDLQQQILLTFLKSLFPSMLQSASSYELCNLARLGAVPCTPLARNGCFWGQITLSAGLTLGSLVTWSRQGLQLHFKFLSLGGCGKNLGFISSGNMTSSTQGTSCSLASHSWNRPSPAWSPKCWISQIQRNRNAAALAFPLIICRNVFHASKPQISELWKEGVIGHFQSCCEDFMSLQTGKACVFPYLDMHTFLQHILSGWPVYAKRCAWM